MCLLIYKEELVKGWSFKVEIIDRLLSYEGIEVIRRNVG